MWLSWQSIWLGPGGVRFKSHHSPHYLENLERPFSLRQGFSFLSPSFLPRHAFRSSSEEERSRRPVAHPRGAAVPHSILSHAHVFTLRTNARFRRSGRLCYGQYPPAPRAVIRTIDVIFYPRVRLDGRGCSSERKRCRCATRRQQLTRRAACRTTTKVLRRLVAVDVAEQVSTYPAA